MQCESTARVAAGRAADAREAPNFARRFHLPSDVRFETSGTRVVAVLGSPGVYELYLSLAVFFPCDSCSVFSSAALGVDGV